MMLDADLDLINAACNGDTEAIERMLLQYYPTVLRFARKYCATPEDVEDAVQETLWIASQKIGTLRVASAFVAWLFRVVRNQCYQMLHYKQHEEAIADFGDASEVSSEQSVLLKQDVIQALARLPLRYREVLILRDIEGLSGAEVAHQLDLTLATVKSRLHYARATMRQALASWRETD